MDDSQMTNTSSKNKKTVKKAKKPSMENKLVVHMHGVKLKGSSEGSSSQPRTIEGSSEEKVENMDECATRVPLTMYNLI